MATDRVRKYRLVNCPASRGTPGRTPELQPLTGGPYGEQSPRVPSLIVWQAAHDVRPRPELGNGLSERSLPGRVVVLDGAGSTVPQGEG